MTEILLATKNPGKKERYKRVLGRYEEITVLTLDDLDPMPTPEEPYLTAAENARTKALTYFAHFQIPIIASDEALYVDFLPERDQIGVHARRLRDKKTEMTDSEVYDWWQDMLSTHEGDLGGYWEYAYVYVHQDGSTKETVIRHPFDFVRNSDAPLIPGYVLSAFCRGAGKRAVYADLTEEERLDADDELSDWLTDAVISGLIV